VTAVEAYDLTTQGGATDFARVIATCESFGPYCLIGGLALNTYVEPVYTLDADIVVIASSLSKVSAHLRDQGFRTFSSSASRAVGTASMVRRGVTPCSRKRSSSFMSAHTSLGRTRFFRIK
jgi:hypothetical protein